MKKLLTSVMSLMTALSLTFGASACTAIYVGGDYTESGNPIFSRIEDLSNSYNKVYNVVPAGVHKAGEAYEGCYGFTYTFTHDSYGYNAFQDDNLSGTCPDCDGTHTHTPYQAAGTNEMGVSMTATETLGNNEAIDAVDPMNYDTGIEEADITTVILSEAATAKEGVELLTKIYDEKGCQGGSGIFIADQKEIWYIENTTGSQYVAVKLNNGVCFLEPNMSVIGLVDLDDTDNVIASKDLIAKAKEAGTFVGNEEENQIDFMQSYETGYVGIRMINGLNFVTGSNYAEGDVKAEDYVISNVGEDGSIVPFASKVVPAKKFTVSDVAAYQSLPTIGTPRNLETHIFEINPDADVKVGAVEWVSMNDNAFSLFVPYYPMMTTDVFDAYKVGTEPAVFTEEKPEEGFFYPTTSKKKVDDEWVTVEGYKTLPAGWETSYYWTFDALSNYCEYVNPDCAEEVKAKLADVQAEIDAEFLVMKASVEDGTATPESLTAASSALAEKAFTAAGTILAEQMNK
ncbi:MAG: C69 family dipeptidase [Clostridia bacterium]|nr:C69 family dipeptidase [Clostridia bacterium]